MLNSLSIDMKRFII